LAYYRGMLLINGTFIGRSDYGKWRLDMPYLPSDMRMKRGG
jgi:hypothetical protein